MTVLKTKDVTEAPMPIPELCSVQGKTIRINVGSPNDEKVVVIQHGNSWMQGVSVKFDNTRQGWVVSQYYQPDSKCEGYYKETIFLPKAKK